MAAMEGMDVVRQVMEAAATARLVMAEAAAVTAADRLATAEVIRRVAATPAVEGGTRAAVIAKFQVVGKVM